jgi:hypothetical protein
VIVRKRTEPRSEYKGRPFDACDDVCPCRPCCNNHDCGKPKPIYKNGVHVSYDYKAGIRMECATRYNGGCPQPKPKPEHIFASDRARVCKRCGAGRPKVDS